MTDYSCDGLCALGWGEGYDVGEAERTDSDLDFLDSFPWEVIETTFFEVYDAGRARIVAQFFSREEVESYVAEHNAGIR